MIEFVCGGGVEVACRHRLASAAAGLLVDDGVGGRKVMVVCVSALRERIGAHRLSVAGVVEAPVEDLWRRVGGYPGNGRTRPRNTC